MSWEPAWLCLHWPGWATRLSPSSSPPATRERRQKTMDTFRIHTVNATKGKTLRNISGACSTFLRSALATAFRIVRAGQPSSNVHVHGINTSTHVPMHFARDAKGCTSDHVAFNSTAFSVKGPRRVFLCTFERSRIPFQLVSRRSGEPDLSGTASSHRRCKTFQATKKSESDLHSGSLSGSDLFFFYV